MMYKTTTLAHPDNKQIVLRSVRNTQSQQSVVVKHNIQQLAQAKNIPYLVHFTHVDNLASILANGILPRAFMQEQGWDFRSNDSLRLDGYLNASSLSISFPNHSMLWKLRQRTASQQWVILLIDPAVLWLKDTAYSQYNAADKRITSMPLAALKSTQAFAGMFAEPTAEQSSRQAQGLFNYDPTDKQAEILVFDNIEPAFIQSVCFYDRQAMAAQQHLFAHSLVRPQLDIHAMFSSREWARRNSFYNVLRAVR